MKKLKTIYLPGYIQIDGVHEDLVTAPRGYENYYEAEQELLDLHLKPIKKTLEVNILDSNGNSQFLKAYTNTVEENRNKYYFIATICFQES